MVWGGLIPSSIGVFVRGDNFNIFCVTFIYLSFIIYWVPVAVQSKITKELKTDNSERHVLSTEYDHRLRDATFVAALLWQLILDGKTFHFSGTVVHR